MIVPGCGSRMLCVRTSQQAMDEMSKARVYSLYGELNRREKRGPPACRLPLHVKTGLLWLFGRLAL